MISMPVTLALAWLLPKGNKLCGWRFICHAVSYCTTGILPLRLQSPNPSGIVSYSHRKLHQRTDLIFILGDILVSQPLQ